MTGTDTDRTPDVQRTHHVIFSGGLDSTSLLALVAHYAAEVGERVRAVSFDYGQRHRVELDRARQITATMDIEHAVLDLRGLVQGSALVDHDIEVPLAGYDEPTMALTVVHGRNMLFASATIASAAPGDVIHVGVHGGDHHVYGDCRPEFWEPYARAVASAYGVEVNTPFIDRDKTYAVTVGHAYDAPLGMSWSCYQGGSVQCGQCGTCRERREAFVAASVTDPTRYVDSDSRGQGGA